MATDFSQWLNRQIKGHGWSGAAFSRQSGIAQSTVSSWIRGTRVPDPASCDLIADVLGVDRDLVLALAGHRPEAEPIPDDDPRRQIHALVDLIDWTANNGVTSTIVGSLRLIRDEQLKARRKAAP